MNRPTTLLLIAGFCFVTITTLGQTKPPAKAPSPSTAVTKRQITSEEKIYAGAAMSYLKTAHDQGLNLATTMAGASTGRSSLTDIEKAVSRATSVENAGYIGDYKTKFKAVPALFTTVAKDIDESHRLFQSAMTEYRQFFKTQSTAYITSAQGIFQRSSVLQTKTIADLNKKLDSVRP